jgi:hypothetical protein
MRAKEREYDRVVSARLTTEEIAYLKNFFNRKFPGFKAKKSFAVMISALIRDHSNRTKQPL